MQIQHSSASRNIDTKLPKIFDGKYFVVMKIDEDKIDASCKLCGCSRSGSIKSTGNFLSHIKRMHGEKYMECKEYIALKVCVESVETKTQTVIGVQHSKKKVW